MTHPLPFDYVAMLSDTQQALMRDFLTPMAASKPGDVVGIVVDHQATKSGTLIAEPIRSIVHRVPDFEKSPGHYQISFFRSFNPEEQARIALPLKSFEANFGIRTSEVRDVANQLISGMLVDQIRAIVTSEVILLYHHYAGHWIDIHRKGQSLNVDDINRLIRVIIPNELSAHSKIELMGELSETVELINSLQIFPHDRIPAFKSPNLAFPVSQMSVA